MTALITGSPAFRGIAGATATVVPSSEGGLSLSPDFAATLASRVSTSGGATTGRGAGAPVATSFASGRLFGSAISYANAAFRLEQPDDVGSGAAETVNATPEDTALPLSGRPPHADELISGNGGAGENSSAPQAFLEPYAQEHAIPPEQLLSDLCASREKPETSSAADPELVLPGVGHDSPAAGAGGSTTSQSVLNSAADLASPAFARKGAESAATLARAEQVIALSPVNVSLLQTETGLSLIARVSGLAQSDESILREQLLRAAGADGLRVADMAVNGRRMGLTRGERP